MSEIKVNKLTPRTNCGTTTLGDSGDTINIPAGVTISNNGTATGFGATGAVNWDVASIKTVDFTAVSGVGYFVDTATTGAVIVTLPAAPAVGDVVGVSDYAKNFSNANCTLNNNSLKISGVADNATVDVDGIAVTLVYVDVTKGWIVTDSGNQSDAAVPLYVTATGGCITTCGNYKIHTFLSPATFTVSSAGNCAGSNKVEYLVIGGGGGAAGAGPCNTVSGGSGAGGYRESPGTTAGSYTVSPLGVAPAAAVAVSASPGSYPVIVGGGGTAGTYYGGGGTPGCTSSALCISSAGGGRSKSYSGGCNACGGSGGGGGAFEGPPVNAGGAGNTPSVTPPQGNPGGTGGGGQNPSQHGGGGGGAICAGGNGSGGQGGIGGAGATSSINTTPTARAGGGGGGGGTQSSAAGGAGGGGQGNAAQTPGTAGTVNTGGGGGGVASGGGSPSNPYSGGAGGSGIVIVRYKYQ